MMFKAYARSRGVSLIELMIGLAIGLVLIAFVGSAYIAQSSTTRATDESSRLQETGRIAINAVERVVRSSGFVPYGEGKSPPTFCKSTATTTDNAAGDPPVLGPFLEGREGTGHLENSDRLVLRFYGSGPDTSVTGDAAIRDCRGVSVAGPASGANATVNTLYVDRDVDNSATLFCSVRVPGSSGAGTRQALIPGVESFQVLYQTTDGTTTSPQRLVTAAQVTDWKQVVAVRVAMIIAGDIGSRPDNDTKTYDMFDALYSTNVGSVDPGSQFVTPTVLPAAVDQRRLRRVFSTTIELRNSPGGILC
jgi:type IV pilus assembly protein PilW